MTTQITPAFLNELDEIYNQATEKFSKVHNINKSNQKSDFLQNKNNKIDLNKKINENKLAVKNSNKNNI